MSWSSRSLITIQQKIEVVKVFALTRMYYVASVLPMRAALVKKMESIIGKYLWAGSGVLRVALEDLKNNKINGGLNLPCIATMNKSLMASQCIRLLNSNDVKSVSHIEFWMGPLMASVCPWMNAAPLTNNIPEYFSQLGDIMASIMLSGTLSTETVKTLTNRIIYRSFMSCTVPHIVNTNPGYDYLKVWRRLHELVPVENREIMFKLLHNKLPVPERLHRIGVRNDPYCLSCPGQEISDIVHYLCTCTKVSRTWTWLRLKMRDMCWAVSRLPDWELLNLFLPVSCKSHEAQFVWLISHYVAICWDSLRSEKEVKSEEFFGFLTYKYKGSAVVSRAMNWLNLQ